MHTVQAGTILTPIEGEQLQETCARFGFTRESFRTILERFRQEGLLGLFDRKRGRKGPVKVTEEVRQFLLREHKKHPELSVDDLVHHCEEETDVLISRRSAYRALSESDPGEQNNNGCGKPHAEVDCHVFLEVGGGPQQGYEQLRGDAVSGGGDVRIFVHRGMALFASRYSSCARGVWEIRRRRASVRAGEFSLVEFFSDMGIEPAASRQSAIQTYVEAMS